ncbi:Spx/MgsR family RNA polymerase-binding regulatory protein [Lactococcus allomyrinae]|uniref:Spx/MgsR family RNA polymerase-binding regulatory protein n=2 Tax=Lactococcus allomyrinae TaxID=2419773 RepID=A0A387BH09_9LACT|nr:Spx/MgsR family RNA polymerase-binding regulatory protein [Lactococcus allomyrinae]
MKIISKLAELLDSTEDYLLGRTKTRDNEIILYTRKSCPSSKKAKRWLENHGIRFKEIDLLSKPLTKIEFVRLLQLTENGTKALIGERSSAYQKLKRKMDFNELTIRELTDYIQEYPTLLKTPIIHDEKQIQVGFNEERIRSFIPRVRRNLI